MPSLPSTRLLNLALGPLAACLVAYIGSLSGWENPASFTAGITTWTAIWWVTEPVPIPVTSLLPVALFPAFGILTHAQVGQAYGHWLIILLLGGFIISTALEKSGAHRRLALKMINLVGGDSHRKIVLGFMLASACLSMWISNTATTLMLVPVALAVIQQDSTGNLAKPLLLGLAYAGSIGGMGTPIGTPPNLVAIAALKEQFDIQIGFIDWMKFGVPVVLCLIPIAWLYLTRKLGQSTPLTLPAVGTLTTHEKRVLMVFAVIACAWVFRKQPFGGWSGFFEGHYINDATVALGGVVLLFIVPDGKGEQLLDWKTAVNVPWGLLLLFSGGIVIGSAFKASGLSTILGNGLMGLSGLPILVMVGLLCFCITFMTEVTSNTATSNLVMPILASMAVSLNLDPAALMIPVAVTTSCAFMLPVATAPNAVVFGTGEIRLALMAKTGFALNLAGVGVVSLLAWLILL